MARVGSAYGGRGSSDFAFALRRAVTSGAVSERSRRESAGARHARRHPHARALAHQGLWQADHVSVRSFATTQSNLDPCWRRTASRAHCAGEPLHRGTCRRGATDLATTISRSFAAGSSAPSSLCTNRRSTRREDRTLVWTMCAPTTRCPACARRHHEVAQCVDASLAFPLDGRRSDVGEART